MCLLHCSQQRFEHKGPQMQPRMGKHQTRLVQAQLTPEQQIKIQHSRTPALLCSAIAPKATFKPVQHLQQFGRQKQLD